MGNRKCNTALGIFPPGEVGIPLGVSHYEIWTKALGWVVRKAVYVNPGLKVTGVTIFLL